MMIMNKDFSDCVHTLLHSLQTNLSIMYVQPSCETLSNFWSAHFSCEQTVFTLACIN